MLHVKAYALFIFHSVQFPFLLSLSPSVSSLKVYTFMYFWFCFGNSKANRESDYTEKDLESLQNLLRSSARDCVPNERSSLVDFQSKTGVEVVFYVLSLLLFSDDLKDLFFFFNERWMLFRFVRSSWL